METIMLVDHKPESNTINHNEQQQLAKIGKMYLDWLKEHRQCCRYHTLMMDALTEMRRDRQTGDDIIETTDRPPEYKKCESFLEASRMSSNSALIAEQKYDELLKTCDIFLANQVSLVISD